MIERTLGKLAAGTPQAPSPTSRHSHAADRSGGATLIGTTLLGATLAGAAVDGGTLTDVTITGPLADLTVYDNRFAVNDHGDTTADHLVRFDITGTVVGLAADVLYALPFVNDTVALCGYAQTLANKELTAPTIGDFTNATHNHHNAATGDTVDHTQLTSKGTNTHATIDTHIAATAAHGTVAPTTWTPTVSQSAAVTLTVQFARYQVLGKMASVQARLTLTGGGTAGNQFIVNGIPASIAPVQTGSHVPVGTFVYHDASASYYQGAVIAIGANDLRFVTNNNGAAGVYFGNVPSMTLASGDELNFTAAWEIA